jgi:hypothetical protein
LPTNSARSARRDTLSFSRNRNRVPTCPNAPRHLIPCESPNVCQF